LLYRSEDRKEAADMIDVTKMNGGNITVNADLIETVEETPDTIITLTTGKKIIVKESRQEVKNLVKSYRSECNSLRID
jgi:flagellar protein FlbD